MVPVAALGAAAVGVLLWRRRRRTPEPPQWYHDLFASAKRLHVDEWENGSWWRLSNGWVGNDYCHGPDAGVRIIGYALSGAGVGTKLVGACYYSPNAESHKGLCHGGSMCSVMDDVIGWVGFCVSGECQPWCGFTVQVNTALQNPVPVGAWLRLEGEITAVDRRKVHVKASLVAPPSDASGKEVVHCTADGLFIVKKGLENGHA